MFLRLFSACSRSWNVRLDFVTPLIVPPFRFHFQGARYTKIIQFSFFEILAIAGFKETGRACQTLGHHAISDCSFNRSSGAFTCRYGADLTNIVTSTWSKIANRFPLLRRVLVDDKTDITSSSCFISCDEEEMASDGEEEEKSGRSRYCMHSPDLWSEETRRCVGVVDFCASA